MFGPCSVSTIYDNTSLDQVGRRAEKEARVSPGGEGERQVA